MNINSFGKMLGAATLLGMLTVRRMRADQADAHWLATEPSAA